MVGKKGFLNTMNIGKGIGYAIIVKTKNALNTIRSQLHKEVDDMLDQFDNIVSDGKHTLPCKRVIIYQIDLITGEFFPNKIVYKMTPCQHDEIAKQV